jgi:hypothetical protein
MAFTGDSTRGCPDIFLSVCSDAAAAAKKKPKKSLWARTSKVLFGWARTTHKVNGKKLLPHTNFLWSYMVRGPPSLPYSPLPPPPPTPTPPPTNQPPNHLPTPRQ